MKNKFRIGNGLRVALILLLVAGLVAFADRKVRTHTCKDIVVELDNIQENHFLDEADVLRLVESGPDRLRNRPFDEIDYGSIEERLERQRNLQDAQVFHDFKGNLVVHVELRRPMARLVQEKGADAYLSEDGVVMPVSERYSSRVIIISGAYAQKTIVGQRIGADDYGKQILDLLRFIREDEFWRAQISEIRIHESGKLDLYPQVGSQVIALGKPDQLEDKFFRLKVFFKEILPRQGWNKYRRVSLEYAGQVIAK